MTIEQKIGVHNKFELELTDARTGEVKQKAYGYNLVLNQYFNFLANFNQNCDFCPLSRIALGTGSATPAVTDTDFRQRVYKAATLVEYVRAYPTSHITQRITAGTSEWNGYTFTRVGYMSSSDSSPTYDKPVTHALLQDAEGNPISIVKTDTDILTVTATFYVTYETGGFGDRGIYPSAENNDVIDWLMGRQNNTIHWVNATPFLSATGDCETATDAYNHRLVAGNSKSAGLNATARTITYNSTVGEGTWNNLQIKTFGLHSIGALRFPDHSVFSDYPIENEICGTGDGEKRGFNTSAPLAQAGTAHVYVDGIEADPDTMYNFDYASNCLDLWANYATAEIRLSDAEHVHFGDFADKPAGSTACYEPFYFAVLCSTGIRKNNANVTVTEEKPIWLDFGNGGKRCNIFKCPLQAPPAAQLDNLKIQYSADNEEWTDVSYTRDGTTYTFAAVTARYWRIFVPSYTWTVALNSGTSVKDGGIATTNKMALGYTGPAIRFVNPPADGAVVSASYCIDIPYKTANNLIRYTFVVHVDAE